MTGATLAAGSTCTVTLNVAGVTDGAFINTTSTIASSGGAGLAATAPITVTNIIDPREAFQVRYYVSNLNTPGAGDSVVNLTYTGTLIDPAGGLTTSGNICVNVYTFDANGELISCCSSLVTPNGLNSLSAQTDLISNTLTAGKPNSAIIKLVASRPLGGSPAGVGGSCNASAAAHYPGQLRHY